MSAADGESLEALGQDYIAHIPHCGELGMTVERVDSEAAVMRMPAGAHLIGDPDSGRIHGGAITTLIDSVCGLCVLAAMPSPGPIATLDLRIDYLRPATASETLRAHAHCFRLTRYIAFVRASAYHTDIDNPIAAAQASFIVKGRSGGLSGDGGGR